MSRIRDRWPSRTLFIFATVGSAVGLGNIWRFPYLAGKYGGGAFLLPYLIALFLIGVPLMIMEFALGQKMQQGAVGAMRKIHPKLAGIGLGAVLSSFGVSCYYATIMGWCILYTLFSFTLAWGDDPQTFFNESVLHLSPSANQIEGFALPVLGAVLVGWVMVYFSIWKGVKSVSKVVTVTMPLPIGLLLILLGRCLFLEGAFEGIHYYLKPDYSALFDLDVWMAAVTQIFFTLTLGFGVMITYASYQDPKSDVVKNAFITSIADVAIALTAGFVIFATLGYMSTTGDIDISQLAASGPSLAFIVLPKALSLIPGAIIVSIMFFLMLITLAIDSLFSLVEAIAALFEDHFPHISKKMIVFFVCFVCMLGGLVFTTSAGIYYLDIVDHFITNYGLVLMGCLQSIAVGWFYGPEKLRAYINEVSEIQIGRGWDFIIKYLIPVCLIWILLRAFIQDLSSPYENYPQWAIWSFGWGLVGCIIFASLGYTFFQNRNTKKVELDS